jgi:hypothetical protein
MLTSKLFKKLSYSYDQTGEIADAAQENIEDTSDKPEENHETEHNAVNLSSDAQAEKDFPGLGRHQVRMPTRTD